MTNEGDSRRLNILLFSNSFHVDTLGTHSVRPADQIDGALITPLAAIRCLGVSRRFVCTGQAKRADGQTWHAANEKINMKKETKLFHRSMSTLRNNSRWLELENVFHNNNSMNLNVVAGRATLAIPYILDKHTFPYYLYLIPYNI